MKHYHKKYVPGHDADIIMRQVLVGDLQQLKGLIRVFVGNHYYKKYIDAAFHLLFHSKDKNIDGINIISYNSYK